MTSKRYRFRKSQRLNHPSQYKLVFEQGRRYSSPCFVMIVRSSAHQGSRLGLVVSRKNARQAVQRNRIRRVVRESFRQRHELRRGFDIIIKSRSAATRTTNTELGRELEYLWQRITK